MDLGAALRMAEELVGEHGLRGWRVRFDRAKTRAGACRPATREITLSSHLTRLHEESEVRDTVLHEIAHALVGPGHGHDEVWRGRALAIGCSGDRCTSADSPRVQGDWVGTCVSGHVVSRHRRPTRVLFCGQCPGRPRPGTVLSWTHRGQRVQMHPNYVAELTALADPGQGGRVPVPGRLSPGTRVRITAQGPYFGVEAPIAKRGRTRYHLRVDGGMTLTVPFAYVDPVGG